MRHLGEGWYGGVRLLRGEDVLSPGDLGQPDGGSLVGHRSGNGRLSRGQGALHCPRSFVAHRLKSCNPKRTCYSRQPPIDNYQLNRMNFASSVRISSSKGGFRFVFFLIFFCVAFCMCGPYCRLRETGGRSQLPTGLVSLYLFQLVHKYLR